MKYSPGDSVVVVCEKVGKVVKDPTGSIMSVLVDFGGELARLPADGTMLGLKCVKLRRVEHGFENTDGICHLCGSDLAGVKSDEADKGE